MHWVIQQGIFKPDNYQLLVNALEAVGIEYTSINIPKGTLNLLPDIAPNGNVYVCGAIKLAQIARQRAWTPGSFLNENFTFDLWLDELGEEMLNADVMKGKLADIRTGHLQKFFIRPLEDVKVFDGTVIDTEMLEDWRKDPAKRHMLALDVIVSGVKSIYREYRIFVVNRKVITGSCYKVGGKPYVSSDVEEFVIDYAKEIINTWIPAESCVIDIGLTEQGVKIIEFNNINSSGFYASNVGKYVQAIQAEYS